MAHQTLEDRIMALFGRIASYDEAAGSGFITPSAGGENLPFAKTALLGGASIPKRTERFQYEAGSTEDGALCAVNLRRA